MLPVIDSLMYGETPGSSWSASGSVTSGHGSGSSFSLAVDEDAFDSSWVAQVDGYGWEVTMAWTKMSYKLDWIPYQ